MRSLSMPRRGVALLKRLLSSLVRPMVRPLARRFDDRIRRLVEEVVRPWVVDDLERRIRPTLELNATIVRDSSERNEAIFAELRRSSQENVLLLDSLVRELVRVQMQLDALERREEEGAGERERLMIG